MSVMQRRQAQLYCALVSFLLLACTLDAWAEEERFGRLLGTTEWQPESAIPSTPQKMPGMLIWEVTQYPENEQTPEQKQAAEDLVRRSYEAAEKMGWTQFEASVRGGYMGMFQDDIHYANEEYILDDAVLDPERPEFLMYYRSGGKRILVGFMYLVGEPLAEGPQIGGGETVWHYHVWSRKNCLLGELLVVGLPDENGVCRRGSLAYRSPEMMHVWLVDHPDGPFTSNMAMDRDLLASLVERRRQERGY